MKALLTSCVLIAAACAVVGCQQCGGTGPGAKSCAPKEKAAPPPQPGCRQTTKQVGPNEVLSVFPCTDCGVVRIEKVMPKQATVKEPFEYNIIVTNLTDAVLEDVVVTERLAPSFQYIGSKPTAKQDRQMLSWTTPSLAAKAAKTFTVAGTGAKAGEVLNCTNVTYYLPSCAATKVVEPLLALTHTAPSTKVMCDEIEMKIAVTNQGTGSADNVKVSARLPDGLNAGGARTVDINVGTLAPGAAKEYVAKLTATKTGTYTLQAVASAEGNLAVESAPTKTSVTQPVLVITKKGPSTQFLHRAVEYTITVTNKGNAPAMDTIVEDSLPADISDVRASEGGVKDGPVVRWKAGTIEAGASKDFTVAYMATKETTLANSATAWAYCADAVSASAKTLMKTIPALLLEVIDVHDPVAVGEDETYRITVTNQGSAIATNITVKCPLELEFMQYLSSTGPSTGTLTNGVVVFEPLATLAPKAKATWEVRVKGIKRGDVRFKTIMKSDQLQRDVEETEATDFYQ